MKTITLKYIGLVCFVASIITSCQLTEPLDDLEPLFQLNADNAIATSTSAELALIGAYTGFRQNTGGGTPELFMFPSFMSGLAAPTFFFDDPENNGFVINNPVSVGTRTNREAYSGMYSLIRRCNLVILGLPNVPDNEFGSNPARRAEIMAEAKALRATANFYLLRLWGQFYDVNSSFGIVLRNDLPVSSEELFPRSTVLEVYDAIIADLDDAILNAPDLRAKFYINKTYAKALKSKVLLYKGEYAEAATLAKDVIDNSGASFSLAATFDEVFDNSSLALFDSNEVIFGTKGEPGALVAMGNLWGFYPAIEPAVLTFAATGTMDIGGQMINYDSNRASSQFIPGNFGIGNHKYNAQAGDAFEFVYHMRMAELYLIFAEADARATNSVSTDALDALNAVRMRAGATTTGADGFETYPAAITYNQFLEAVRVEKYIELGGEMGEEWYDLVRYDFADGFGSGFQVSDVKPTATDSDKFILPIVFEVIQAGGNVVDQNPSY